MKKKTCIVTVMKRYQGEDWQNGTQKKSEAFNEPPNPSTIDDR